jgi:hypothetical protein
LATQEIQIQSFSSCRLQCSSLVCDEKDWIMPFLLKKVIPISLLTLAFLSCSASCGRQYDANPSLRTYFAYVQGGCGPTDDPAIEFYFTPKRSQFGKYAEPFIMIAINENLPSSTPRAYSIKSGQYAVLASRCLKPGQCDAATSGTLHLTSFRPGKGATGDYELYFQDGRVERDSFDAMWYVVEPLVCG